MINEARLVQEFMEMVKIDSLSKKERKFAHYIKGKMEQLGLEVIVDQQAGEQAGSDTGNLLGRLKGTAQERPPLFLAAHLDTVPPGVGICPQVKDGIIYSNGATILGSDDKAGIAIILEVIRHLQEEKIVHGDLEVVFTVSEEVGLLGSRYLDDRLLKAKMGFVLDCDGPPGTIVAQAPAHERLQAVIHGQAAHAGMNPEEGIDAIQVAAEAITQMNLLRIDEETTANIGMIKGGAATNIVCERVELVGEARSLSEEKLLKQVEEMLACLQKACQQKGARLEVKVTREYPAFKLAQEEPLIKIAEKAAQALGLVPRVIASGGGSDTNFFNTRGLKAVNLGIGMQKPHTKEECIAIKDLVMATHYVAKIIEKIK